MYSVGANGELLAHVMCDDMGRVLLNGAGFSSVRYENLVTGLNAQNVLINAELSKIAIALNSLALEVTMLLLYRQT